MNQHWVRQWLGTEKLPSHYQGSNEDPAYWRIYASLGLNKFPSKYRTKTIKRIFFIYKNICTSLQHYIHKSFHIPSHTHIHTTIFFFKFEWRYKPPFCTVRPVASLALLSIAWDGIACETIISINSSYLDYITSFLNWGGFLIMINLCHWCSI